MRTVLVTLLASLAASSLGATCESAAGNLLAKSNCGFDKDASGWSALPDATVSRDASEDGVLKAKGDPSGSLTVFGLCVPVQGGTGYKLSARLRTAEGTAYFCSVNTWQFADAQCGEGADPHGSAARPPAAKWNTVEGSATTAADTKSVQFRPICSGEPGFVVMFDDFVLVKN